MTNEEALKNHIKSMICSKDFWENDTRQALAEEHIDYYNAVINALEKQIPKKPNIDGYVYVAFHKFAEGTCPTCRRRINENANDFCSGCGQKIDWSDADDE